MNPTELEEQLARRLAILICSPPTSEASSRALEEFHALAKICTARAAQAATDTVRAPRDFGKASLPRLLYTKKESAYQLSISLRSISYLITKGQIRTRKIGGRTLIPRAELLRFSRFNRPSK